jgi:broad specificity phosphatase PhoE
MTLRPDEVLFEQVEVSNLLRFLLLLLFLMKKKRKKKKKKKKKKKRRRRKKRRTKKWPVIRYWLYQALKREGSKHRAINKPKRIIIIRHGESGGNTDLKLYASVADNQIPLTAKGEQQAREVGLKLKEIVGEESCRFFVSPYKRTWQTLEGLLETLQPTLYTIREEPRVREQDWGNFQTDSELIQRQMVERRAFGSFFYRMANGESGADVYSRVDSFWSSLYREFEYPCCLDNFLVITHGITARMLLMRYFGWTVDEFHALYNFENQAELTP